MKNIYLFIATSKTGKNQITYSMDIWSEQENYEIPGKTICSHEDTERIAILTALCSFVSEYIEKDVKLVCCCKNKDIAFEWESEYKTDKHFAESTKNKDLWNKIANQVNSKHIGLVIKGNDSVLEELCKK